MPHSDDAEKGVLGSMLQSPLKAIPEAARGCQGWFFYSPANRTIFESLCDHHDSGAAVDLITFTQFLRSRALLDSVGGPAYVTQLFTFVPSAVNIGQYISIVREKAMLREMISVGSGLVRAAHGTVEGADEVANIAEEFGRKIERVKYAAGGPNGSIPQEMQRLMTMDTRDGKHSLVGNNYLVRGGNSLWAGGAGYGKSSLVIQLALYWATGTPIFGLRPSHRLKSLIIQAENDDYDMADQVQGVVKGINSLGDLDVEECKELILANVLIHRVEAKSGGAFLGLLDSLISLVKADLVWVDPLFAYAGCDLMNSEKTGRFLREGLFPIATKYGCCLNVVHHIGKPSRDKGTVELSSADKQYLGFGTSEIQNAFRAVNSLLPVKNHAKDGRRIFGLTFSKRGMRAGAKSPDGSYTDHIFLEYGKDGICWLQCDEPEEPPKKGSNATKFAESDVLEQMSVIHGLKTADVLQKVKDETGMVNASFYRFWKDLKESGKIRVDNDGLWYRKGLAKKAQTD